MLHLLNDLRTLEAVQDVYPFGEFHHVVMKNESGNKELERFVQSDENENFVMQKQNRT